MLNFVYENQTKIIFGKDMELKVGEEVKRYGTKILLHYGGGSIKSNGIYDRIIHSLKKENIEIIELGGVKPNPRLSLVKEGIKLCQENHIEFILAVGGGSVIDSAKAIGIGSKYDGDVWDFYERKAEIKDTLPVGVVLTIPAAGSESSTGSVITNEDGWYKRSTGNPLTRPRFAIMNPELTYTLPDYQTAAGASDMLAHVLERYFTNEDHVDFTDELCEATMRCIIKQSKIILQEPKNYEARAELMWAGTIAHNGLLGTGRMEDWASHGIEHELSALYDLTHGVGLSIVFPAWMKYVYKHDLNRFARFANKVFGIEIELNNIEKTVKDGINQLIHYYHEIGLPTTLKEANIPTDRLEEMAKKATENGPLGNFVQLNEQDVLNIFKLIID